MRKYILTLLIGLPVSILQAQKINVEEVNKKMSQGTNSGFMVVIPRVSSNDAEKDWKRQIKDWEGKAENQKGEVFADNVFLSSVSTNSIDIYAEFKDQDGGCEMFVWFDLGGAFLAKSSHPDQWNMARDIIRDFAYNLAKAALEAVIRDEEKKLSDLQGNLERLAKDKENLEKNIQKWTEDIEQAKLELTQNATDQDAKAKEIEAQKKALEEAQKNLSRLEK